MSNAEGHGGLLAENSTIAHEGLDYPTIVRMVLATGYVSVALLQRTFAIGYTRASNIVERLVREGVVSDLGEHKKPVIQDGACRVLEAAKPRTTPGPIPIDASKHVAEQYAQEQVIILGYAQGWTYTSTWGVTREDSDMAAGGRDRILKLLGLKPSEQNMCADTREAIRAAGKVGDYLEKP